MVSLSSPASCASSRSTASHSDPDRPSSKEKGSCTEEEQYEFRFNDNGMDKDTVTQSLSLEVVKTFFGIVHSPILDGALHMEKRVNVNGIGSINEAADKSDEIDGESEYE